MAFIFIVRAEQGTYYAGTGQPGFGLVCAAGDSIHGPVLSPAIPVNKNSYAFTSVTVPQAVLPDDTTMALVSSIYQDSEYNPGAFPAGDGPATAYAVAVALRTALNAYNTRVSRSVKYYAYFHTPVLDYDPGNGDGVGGVAKYVDGGTVGISQWQDPTDTDPSHGFVSHALSYVTLMKTNTLGHLGGIRLCIYYKGSPATLLTAAQLLAQVQLALSATGVGGLGADIWECYYGKPINPTTYYQNMYDVLANLRNGTALPGRAPAPARTPAPSRSAGS